ncbi:MAG: phage minor tail protein L [Pseudomonadota bacterium]
MPESVTASAAAALELSELGEVIELFRIDLAPFGGQSQAFAPAPVDGAPPRFGGVTYGVIPFESEGWEWAGSAEGGPLPTPRITFRFARDDGDVSSAGTVLLSLIAAYDDFIGAELTRLLTLRRFLDDGATPDPLAAFNVEVYEIERRVSLNSSQIVFQLRSGLDHEDVDTPRRRTTNRCPLIYRVPNLAGDGYDYTGATCPHVGPERFTLADEPAATIAEDRCSKSVAACKLRFGPFATLPFGAFPGAGRLRR